ncbi:myb-related protein 340-like [Camellia sinensis]|uniref:Uncharacterized protein n=1 Tax=Camellia sinensis var. sinensis TaxID=542762 RepID=A0A4S4F0N8_CAMSN|nr:myb-related protein 340-like [Camellia sinensis]THG22534.1 hypothetical protein TEA_025067 [Camellia sinensis var. sinensis]
MDGLMMGWGLPAEQGWRKRPWTPDEDKLLTEYVSSHGEGRWSSVAKSSGLNRSGKSCRLRWVNYLKPGLKRSKITPQEEGIIIELHALWGNKWSTIARYLPGRTDNEIKNYWRTHFKKRGKPSQKQEKGKTQLLLDQQIMKQEQQEQQEEEQGENDNDINNKVLSQAEAIDQKMTDEKQGKQETLLFMYPNMENLCFPMMYQDIASWSHTMDDLWSGGLWNLDEPHGRVDQANDYNKINWN